MRRAAKIDSNQPGIVVALRSVGCSVQPLSAVGKGCPDLLVGHGGKTYLLEVKEADAPKRNKSEVEHERELTPPQVEWHRSWAGHVAIVHSIAEALKAIGL